MVPALFSYRLHFQDCKVKFSRQIATSQNYSETIVFSRIFPRFLKWLKSININFMTTEKTKRWEEIAVLARALALFGTQPVVP